MNKHHTPVAIALYHGGFNELDRFTSPESFNYTPSTEWLSDTGRDMDKDAQGIIAELNNVFHQQALWIGIACFALLSYSFLIGVFLH